MPVRAERYWQQGLACSRRAQACGALVPLHTEALDSPELAPFLLRRLTSRPPRHLRPEGPRPNPFLPWETDLQVELLGDHHVVLLNKYPVQPGHLLLISQGWQPQAGWLSPVDWRAVATLAIDTGGLWFFNSCTAAGASQPHRHLQLLPRAAGQRSCPLAPALLQQLGDAAGTTPDQWPWAYRLSRRLSWSDPDELGALYRAHARSLGLGDPAHDPQPRHPYNLLFDDDWLLTVRRRREHCAGFSLNALGFAGYLLATDASDLTWLDQHGPLELLRQVAWPEQESGGPSRPIP